MTEAEQNPFGSFHFLSWSLWTNLLSLPVNPSRVWLEDWSLFLFIKLHTPAICKCKNTTLFGSYIPSPSRTNYMFVERAGDVQKQPNLTQIHNQPLLLLRPYPRSAPTDGLWFQIGWGEGYCFVFPPSQTPIFPFFHLICAKINSWNKHSLLESI